MFTWLKNLLGIQTATQDTPLEPWKPPTSPSFSIEIGDTTCLFRDFRWDIDVVLWNDMEVKLHRDYVYIVPHRIWDVREYDGATAHVELYSMIPFSKNDVIIPSSHVVRAFAHLLCHRSQGNRIRVVSGRIMMYIPKLDAQTWASGFKRLCSIVSLWNTLSKVDPHPLHDISFDGQSAKPLCPMPTQNQILSPMQEWILSCFDGARTDWSTASWDIQGFYCISHSDEEADEAKTTCVYGALLWDWASQNTFGIQTTT